METGISDLSGSAASVEAAPFFDIDRTEAARTIADMAATIGRWRTYCRSAGLTARQLAD